MTHPLFADILSREAVLSHPARVIDRELTIQVHRNHSFELIAPVLNVFLGLGRMTARYIYSGYDDSVSFNEVSQDADVHLAWLDVSRYQLEDLAGWLAARAAALKTALGKGMPVIFALCGTQRTFDIDGVHVFWCDTLFQALGIHGYDERLAPFSGTRLSAQACLQLARELGVHQIPSLVSVPLKALILDLDETLYKGVLGEDGPDGLEPYTDVQRHLKKLSQQGFLLALSSKNNEDDVRRMFDIRQDFPLRWDDFAACEISWKPKVEGILSIAQQLNVGLDSLLFVDDNPGELLEVQIALPQVYTLAADDAVSTLNGLRWFPGLQKNSLTHEDSVRREDIKANRNREILRQTVSREEYLRQLGITLTIEINPVRHRTRIQELLHKTNQYVFSFLRPDTESIETYLSLPGHCLVTASMTDALSDSGVIAVALVRKDTGSYGNSGLIADEVAVSCRALGRGIERDMVLAMLKAAEQYLYTPPHTAGTITNTETYDGMANNAMLENTLTGGGVADCNGGFDKAMPVTAVAGMADSDLTDKSVTSGMFDTDAAKSATCHENTAAPWRISYQRGPRNQPAIDWLNAIAGETPAEKGILTVTALPYPDLQFVTVHVSDC